MGKTNYQGRIGDSRGNVNQLNFRNKQLRQLVRKDRKIKFNFVVKQLGIIELAPRQSNHLITDEEALSMVWDQYSVWACEWVHEYLESDRFMGAICDPLPEEEMNGDFQEMSLFVQMQMDQMEAEDEN